MLHSHVRDKILGKVTEIIFKICYGSGVMQQKVGLRVNLTPPPPPDSMCVKNHFRPKASAHRSRSPHIDVLATDGGQPYAGEWTNCLRIIKSVTRKVVERFTDSHLANK